MKKYSNIYVNKRYFLKKFQNNNNKNLVEKKTCEYCKMSFQTIQKLRHHIIIDCFQNEVNETLGLQTSNNTETIAYDEVIRLDNSNNNIINSFNTINTINNDNSKHIHINNNVYINITNPFWFSQPWEIKKSVIEKLSDIYDSKKEKALNIYNEIIQNENLLTNTNNI